MLVFDGQDNFLGLRNWFFASGPRNRIYLLAKAPRLLDKLQLRHVEVPWMFPIDAAREE